MTIAVHLLTGYLALLSLGVLVLIRPSRLLRNLGRAAITGVGAVLIASWGSSCRSCWDWAFTVQDEFSRGKVFYDSFGEPEHPDGLDPRGDLRSQPLPW